MRLRSTGLGKTELIGEVEDLTRMGDFLIMVVQTTKPVKWKVRAALNHKDLFTLLGFVLRWNNLKYIIFGAFNRKKDPEIPAF
ncbi:MAG: hypothetical protein U1D67_01155 [Dehalococcoidia bacterium]|nr:hypothetical protein [Dehalococcoidia bacterium]MDZ4245706.1 hypothetical protein [Dehalococcoidia bacterium]